MRKKKVTMKDIASEAGVSQPTVSIILNGSDCVRIADDTRQRVLAIAERLGYQLRYNRPDPSRTNKIAFLINSMNMHDPFINAISAAREEAWAKGIVLVVLDYEDSEAQEQALVQEISQGDYSGVIYAQNMTKEMPLLQLPPALPVVMLNCYPTTGVDVPCILPDNVVGAYQVTRHLIRQGCQRIALISGEPWAQPAQDREQGYRQALLEAQLDCDERLLVTGNWSIRQSYLQTRQLLALAEPPDAIFSTSDFMTVGVYQALAEHHLKIPDDIAVASYDNQLLADELTPALTSFDLPYDDMGRLAVSMVTEPQTTAVESKSKVVDGELYVRQSTVTMTD